MDKTATEATINYIKQHPDIKSCLKKGVINYSSLARLILKELDSKNSASVEAILVAARRYQDKLKSERVNEEKIKGLLKKSEIEIKNKVMTFILETQTPAEEIAAILKEIKKEKGFVYLIEGSTSQIMIIQEKYEYIVEKSIKSHIIKKSSSLALIILKSSKEIESVPGVIAFLTSQFAENAVNIVEFLSCWTDTLFLIKPEDIGKTMEFLEF